MDLSVHIRDIGFIVIILVFCVLSRPFVLWAFAKCYGIRSASPRAPDLTSNQETQCALEMPVCRVVIHPDESLTLSDTNEH